MQDTIKYLQNKIKDNSIIVIGTSGGPDSMCLLYILKELKLSKKLKIIAAHINHNLRKESDEEAKFVKNICDKYDVLYECLELNDLRKKNNLEATARQERYRFYQELLKKYNADYLMTAHHGDDLVETILMRLTRGSNVKGYSGFSIESNFLNYKLVRPLILVTKDDIIKYNKNNNIEYRVDKSNYNLDITRNRYRHNILPLLKQENKNIHKKYLKFSENLNEISECLENIVIDALTKVKTNDKVDLFEFNKLENYIKKSVIERFLKDEYKNDIFYINDRHLELILKVASSNKPNQIISMPKNRKIIKSYQKLYFENVTNNILEEKVLTNKLIINEKEFITQISFCNIKRSNYILRLNSKEIKLPLKVRYKKDGDIIAVKNLNGTKKIKDIFINEKIPKDKRDKIPIIIDSNNNILWIAGIKKSKFDKNIDEFYDIIYKYVISEEIKNENE